MNKKSKKIEPEVAFGLALRRIRLETEISQEELGFRADLHRTYISDIERGVRNPTVRTIWKLAIALKVKPEQIIKLATEFYAQ